MEITQKIFQVLNGEVPFNFLKGDCREVLQKFPDESIDCVITSPPYWAVREYDVDKEYTEKAIGNEKDPQEYVAKLVNVFSEVKKKLKPSGSLWLNIGDKFLDKNLVGMPWRVALALKDDGWILRNDVIWDKMKANPISSKDRVRDIYEHMFHFVKRKKYYYDHIAIRNMPGKMPEVDEKGNVVSITGVSGKKYREQILKSKALNESERQEALKALENTLQKMREGKLYDFRMTIRDQQRTFHGDKEKFSGRAMELKKKGFYIIPCYPKGSMPADIWRIVPEDEWRKDVHYSVFPIELLELPIKATCPKDGVILDPFMGIGSAICTSMKLGRRALGIEISSEYIKIAEKRLRKIQVKLNSYK